jgi:hypothetical protein
MSRKTDALRWFFREGGLAETWHYLPETLVCGGLYLLILGGLLVLWLVTGGAWPLAGAIGLWLGWQLRREGFSCRDDNK